MQDWRGTVSFVLSNFQELGKILDITERDEAGAVLVVPEWPYQAWWPRLHSAAWARRVAAWEFVSGAVLIPNTQDCFFGPRFTTRLLILRIRAAGSCAGRVQRGPQPARGAPTERYAAIEVTRKLECRLKL